MSPQKSTSSAPSAFGPEDERYVLEKAYVPEHIASLMSLISRDEPFLINDHLGYVKDN